MLSQGELYEAAAERHLLEQFRRGDAEAWQVVVGLLRPRLRDLAAAALPAEVARRADASDMVQQSFSEAHETFTAFQGASLPELYAWLAAILNNNVRDAIRRHLVAQGRTVKAECRLDNSANGGWEGIGAADQTTPSMAAVRGEEIDRLGGALRRLPPRQRDAVRLRHLEGRPLVEIAARLECTVPAAAAVIARGLRALRESWPQIDQRAESDHARRNGQP